MGIFKEYLSGLCCYLAWVHPPCLSNKSTPNSRSSGDPNAEAQRWGERSHGKRKQAGSPRHTSATTLRPSPNCSHLALLLLEEETKKDVPSGGKKLTKMERRSPEKGIPTTTSLHFLFKK